MKPLAKATTSPVPVKTATQTNIITTRHQLRGATLGILSALPTAPKDLHGDLNRALEIIERADQTMKDRLQ